MSVLPPLEWASDFVDRLVQHLVVLTSAAFTLVIFVAVLSRYIFNFSLVYYVEASKILFVWSAFLGATVAYKRHVHIRFEFMSRLLGPTGRSVTDILLYLSALVFFVYVFVYAVRFTRIIWNTSLPVLTLSQGWLYVPVFVSAALFFLHSLRLLLETILSLKSREGSR